MLFNKVGLIYIVDKTLYYIKKIRNVKQLRVYIILTELYNAIGI